MSPAILIGIKGWSQITGLDTNCFLLKKWAAGLVVVENKPLFMGCEQNRFNGTSSTVATSSYEFKIRWHAQGQTLYCIVIGQVFPLSFLHRGCMQSFHLFFVLYVCRCRCVSFLHITTNQNWYVVSVFLPQFALGVHHSKDWEEHRATRKAN